MFQLDRWIKGLGLVGGFTLLIGCILWAEKKQAYRICQAIDIHIADTAGHQFIQETNLLALLKQAYEGPLIGTLLQQISAKKIADIINAHNFVHIGKVYKTWNGRIKISIIPRRPIARILHAGKQDQYIDAQGRLLPLSANYTARVLLIHGANLQGFPNNIKDSEHGLAFFQLLTFIDQDPFWHAQITHISEDQQGKLTINTQIGKQLIAFGQLQDINKKMEKLKLFYQVILPYKGWNKYKRVNLEFDNQIVCE